MRKVIVDGNNIRMMFPFDWGVIAVVREIPERRYRESDKTWSVPFTPWHSNKVVEVLSPHGFSIDPAIVKKADSKAKPPKIKFPKGLWLLQKEGIQFAYNAGGRCIIGDDMGLGKTITALSFLEMFAGRTLIVSPANVVYKWGEETEAWCKDKTYQIVDNGKMEIEKRDIHIMSYGIMVSQFDNISRIGYDMVIFDEAHYLKGYKSQRTRVAKYLVKSGISKVLFLSGTPFMNRPAELFPLLNMLDPAGYPNYFSFAKRYCGANRIMGYWIFPNEATNTEELENRLSRVLIRRTKGEYADELGIPSLTRTSVPVVISNMKQYRDAARDIREWLLSKGKEVINPSHALTKLQVLRQVVAEGKVDAAIELAENVLNGGRQVVLFTYHKEIVGLLKDRLKDYGVGIISGDTPQKDREKYVKEFLRNLSSLRVMIITTAGGIGIDLYSAADIIFVERWWTPAIEEQAEARLQRYGQQNPVTAWYVVAKNTVDEKIDRLVRHKRATIGKVIKQDKVLEKELFMEVIKELKGE